jgi:GNAT superfamily N-acetyltransferase
VTSDTSAVIVRRASTEDAERLAAMRWRFSAEFHEAVEPLDAFTSRFSEFARRVLHDPQWAVWVAEADSQLVGTAWMELVERVPRPHSLRRFIGYVTNVYVIPERRSSGVGGRLVEAVIRWGRESDCEILVLWPSEASVRFYERGGFRLARRVMEFPFGELSARD